MVMMVTGSPIVIIIYQPGDGIRGS